MPLQPLDVQDQVSWLLSSEEPSIRWKIRVNVLGEDPESESVAELQNQIRDSHLVNHLLANRDSQGRLQITLGVYGKRQGAHWIMATLADIGYPPGDKSLEPVRDQLLDNWLDDNFYKEFSAATKAASYGKKGVPVMQGRHRRCASQQSNALWSILKLGLANPRTDELVERLLHWQWPDGGWNCDKNPSAHNSSFMESIIPLRALALYGKLTNHQQAKQAAESAASIFLKRKLYLSQFRGSVIKAEFVALHYPLYWHYDILHGLKVMAESGFIDDPGCEPALKLLMEKRLSDGGWAAEKKYYKTSDQIENGADLINWGGTSSKKMNEWVTADALYVLKSADLIRTD